MIETRHILRALAVSAWMLSILGPLSAPGMESRNSVLIVASFEPGSPLEEAQIKALRDALPVDVETTIDYLDATWIGRRKDYLPLYFGVAYRKYKDQRLSAIVALNDDAIRFVDYFRTNLFVGVPLVLCGTDPQLPRELSDLGSWTGVFSPAVPEKTVRLALDLHPAARRVHVISDRTASGQAAVERLRRFAEAGEFTRPVILPAKDREWNYRLLRKKVRQFEPESTVFFANFSRDYGGRIFQPHRLMPFLAAESKAPVYTMQSQTVGAGAVGGYVVNGERLGRVAGEMVVRVLGGEKPEAIPPVILEGEWLFDDVQLKRWQIAESRLPTGSRIVGRRISFFGRHKWILLGGGVVASVELAIIALLLINRAGRIRAQRSLQASETRYRTLFETSDDMFSILDRDGKILHANPAACRLLGHPEGELIGRPHTDLIALADRSRVQAGMERALAGGRAILEVGCLTREGEEVPVEILLQPFSGGEQSAAVCVARSLSERIKIQRLTQEISDRERQAMGCDLHDGLGQYLTALRFLCHRLEKGLEEQRPPGASEIAKLNQIASELAYEVQGLARSLVPLDMLARSLESALQELIEINRRHFHVQASLEFAVDEQRLAPDAAAQVYRIAQEAMRNAVRHGSASEVNVVLRPVAGGRRAELVVENNGRPFDAMPERRSGMGLAIMRQRARLIGAEMEFCSETPAKMRLTCRFPLQPGGPAHAS